MLSERLVIRQRSHRAVGFHGISRRTAYKFKALASSLQAPPGGGIGLRQGWCNPVPSDDKRPLTDYSSKEDGASTGRIRGSGGNGKHRRCNRKALGGGPYRRPGH